MTETSGSTGSDGESDGSNEIKNLSLSKVWDRCKSNYLLLKVLGTGTYGQVVKAKDKKTGEIVAIKLIRDVYGNEYETIKVLREMQILRKLSDLDPNCNFVTRLLNAQIYEDGDQNTHLFIVLEYMESDLRAILDGYPENIIQEE